MGCAVMGTCMQARQSMQARRNIEQEEEGDFFKEPFAWSFVGRTSSRTQISVRESRLQVIGMQRKAHK